jgi:hypothetical protein
MKWPWSKGQSAPSAPTGDGRGERYDAAALEAFLEHARAMATWHEARASAFERKASTLLGFVGVILVLLPTLRAPIAKAHGCHMRMALVGLAITAAGLLVLAAVATAMVLMPRRYEVPGLSQLRREWMVYRGEGRAHLAPKQVSAMIVDQLVRGSKPKSPIETLYADAEKRAKWMKWAGWLVLAGVAVLGSLTTMLLVEGGA